MFSKTKVVFIEGKFWANLTENQPNGYLNELDAKGRLLFLAPEKRIESLKIELKNRTSDKRIEVCSWVDFLKTIERENTKKP